MQIPEAAGIDDTQSLDLRPDFEKIETARDQHLGSGPHGGSEDPGVVRIAHGNFG